MDLPDHTQFPCSYSAPRALTTNVSEIVSVPKKQSAERILREAILILEAKPGGCTHINGRFDSSPPSARPHYDYIAVVHRIISRCSRAHAAVKAAVHTPLRRFPPLCSREDISRNMKCLTTYKSVLWFCLLIGG